MKLDAEEWRMLRREFVEAAATYNEFETFIERDESSEDFYCNNGRYFSLGLIRWPHGRDRKCWILAPDSGSNAEPFSVMKTLFNKAWLWLPPKVANEIVETAEMHLSAWPSPPVGTELFWAKSDYQYWCWILWFHWLRQHRAANPSEAEKPSQKIILAPFHLSADLIAQWGLDGGEGTLPEWLAPKPPLIVPPDPQKVKTAGRLGRLPKDESKLLKTNMLAILREHSSLADDRKKLAELGELGESLDPNSKSILQAMAELQCDELNRTSAKEIIKTAIYSGDEKRAFDQLKRLSLVESKQGRNGGYWMTARGAKVAEKLNGAKGGTVTPTDCTV